MYISLHDPGELHVIALSVAQHPPYFCALFSLCPSFSFFFFNDTATTEIYTLSLHDALPISRTRPRARPGANPGGSAGQVHRSDCLHRRHSRLLRGGRGDPAGRPSSRDRLRALDRDQHLPTGGGPPVHLGRQVYGGPVPHVLLAGAGSAAPAAGPGGGYVRGVPGNFRGVVLLVATGCLTNLDAPGRIRTSDQQLRRLLLYPPELRAREDCSTT